jgi:hypothetical protein
MVRRYAEPVEVLRHDDLPAQFRWRGRWYGVGAVQAHWFEAGGWWRSAAAAAVFGADFDRSSGRPAAAAMSDDLVIGPLPPSPKWGQRSWGEPAPEVGAAVNAAAVDDGERELWRVEAVIGRLGAGVFDLCFDWSAGGWTVARVLD